MLIDMQLSKIHLVLNHQSSCNKNNFDIAIAIKTKLDNTFKNNPVMLPDHLPPDAPKVVFNQDNKFSLAISQIKTNLSFNNAEKISLTDGLIGFKKVSDEVISIIIDEMECPLAKVGFVVIGNLTVPINGTEFIYNKYLKDDYFPEIYGAEAHWLYYPEFSDQKMNRWVRLKSSIDSQNTSEGNIRVTIDTNTINKDEYIINSSFAKGLLEKTIIDFNENLSSILKL